VFLDVLLRRNRAFVDAAVELHRRGELPSNAYVLDLETVRENAAAMRAEGERHGLEVLPMTKQVGRNPALLAAVHAAGLDGFVAVDMADARVVHREALPLGHIGHLVQVPRGEAAAAAAMEPANWTVFSEDKAREAAAAASAIGRTQDLLARIHAPGDTFYSGHEGGFPAAELERVADRLDALEGARFAGITTFPALLYDAEAQAVVPTPNLTTLARAVERLDRPGLRVNAPGTTSSTLFATLAEAGATQVEPGHGLTGTTPLHVTQDLPERPAGLYLTEVSHHHAGRAYCFGGGMYVDPVFPPYQVRAVVAGDGGEGRVLDATLPPPAAIDYYGWLEPGDGPAPATGDSVVFGFRFQAFVTRAYVAALDDVSTGRPRLAGIWTAAGEPARWPS
jgi:predicted amino acid racemase